MSTANVASMVASLATLSNEEFAKVWETSKAKPSARLDLTIGSKWLLNKTGQQVTLARLQPKARSCGFFITDGGELMYLNISRDVKAVPALPAKAK